MQNKKCPYKNSCYNECADCTFGKTLNRLYKKIDKLKTENKKLKAENEELTSRLDIILNHDF